MCCDDEFARAMMPVCNQAVTFMRSRFATDPSLKPGCETFEVVKGQLLKTIELKEKLSSMITPKDAMVSTGRARFNKTTRKAIVAKLDPLGAISAIENIAYQARKKITEAKSLLGSGSDYELAVSNIFGSSMTKIKRWVEKSTAEKEVQ